MLRLLACTFAASAAINIGLVVLGRGSFDQVLAMIHLILLALISVCAGSLILVFGGASADCRRFAARSIAIGLVAGSCLISLPISARVNRYDIEQAKSFCDRLRPELERHRSETGRYPEHMSDVVTKGPLPRLLQGEEFYRSNGEYYSFSFGDPSRIFAGVESDSLFRAWHEWD